MYNRYVPQPDGTFRRNRMEDPGRSSYQVSEQKPTNPHPSPAPEPKVCPCSECMQRPPIRKPIHTYPQRNGNSITGFLKQLLPKDFDMEDLLVILLLLLMAGDCQDDQNTALLTLVLYLFL